MGKIQFSWMSKFCWHWCGEMPEVFYSLTFVAIQIRERESVGFFRLFWTCWALAKNALFNIFLKKLRKSFPSTSAPQDFLYNPEKLTTLKTPKKIQYFCWRLLQVFINFSNGPDSYAKVVATQFRSFPSLHSLELDAWLGNSLCKWCISYCFALIL